MERMNSQNQNNLMEKIISLCKRRGFIFPSSEIYGGFGSSYDFGPLGVGMESNIKSLWWEEMTKNHDNIFGIDAAILMSPKVWRASGHLSAGFADELVECKSCHHRYKKDTLSKNACPLCGGKLTKPRQFNLMMKTFVGPVEDRASTTYLRAETCQGIYINFENVLNSMRAKIPFGIVQIGKAFRNEITPGNFIFRTREFDQMELEWFCQPSEANRYFDYWLNERLKWYKQLGIKKENIKVAEIPKKERAHYARRQVDIEYHFPFGWQELEGIHNRGDWDLSNHSKYSGNDLRYLDQKINKRYYPYIIETSVGVGRLFLALLCNAYQEIKGGRTKTTKSVKEEEIVLKLNKKVAPIKVAVFPLIKKDKKLVKIARDIYKDLKGKFVAYYDEVDSIGRRYRRQDEIGTPYCITVDFDTLKDKKVTIRDRNTMQQERVKIDQLVDVLKDKLK